jgi:hypothetical protein
LGEGIKLLVLGFFGYRKNSSKERTITFINKDNPFCQIRFLGRPHGIVAWTTKTCIYSNLVHGWVFAGQLDGFAEELFRWSAALRRNTKSLLHIRRVHTDTTATLTKRLIKSPNVKPL